VEDHTATAQLDRRRRQRGRGVARRGVAWRGLAWLGAALRRNARYRAFYYGAHGGETTFFSSAVFTPVGPAVTSVLVEAKWVLTARHDGIYCHRVLRIFCDLMGISIARATR
jgi:hypothetical protein